MSKKDDECISYNDTFRCLVEGVGSHCLCLDDDLLLIRRCFKSVKTPTSCDHVE